MPAPISGEPAIFREIPLLKLDMALGLLRRAYKGDVDRSARWLVGMIQAGLVIRGSEAQSELMNCVTHSGWHNSQTRAMAALIVSDFRPDAVVYDAQGRASSQTPIHNRWREVVAETMAKDIRQRVAEYGYAIKYPVTDQRFTALPDEAGRRRASEVPFPFRGSRIDAGEYAPSPFRRAPPSRHPPQHNPTQPSPSMGVDLSSLEGGLSSVPWGGLNTAAATAAVSFQQVYNTFNTIIGQANAQVQPAQASFGTLGLNGLIGNY